MQHRGIVVAFSWLVTWVLGYYGAGDYVAETIVGMDGAMIPLAPTILFAVSALASTVVTIVWIRQRAAGGQESSPSSRRRFLLGGAAVTGGVVGAGAAVVARVSDWASIGAAISTEAEQTAAKAHESWRGARIKGYRALGNTGFRVSDISFGTTQFTTRHPDPTTLLKEALDRGINYIDTSPDYAGAASENAIGKAIVGRPRSDIFLATKWCTPDGHIRQGESVDSYLAALNGSLERLGTDYVDLIHVHACDNVERLLDPNVLEAFETAKSQGKARFLGVSTHTPNLEEVANAAIDSGSFDVIMMAYHHGAWPQQQEIVDRAAKAGIGIVAMKTLKGAKHRGMVDFREDADSYTQAAFKWVLSNPSVACLVVSFFDTQHLDEYIHASGRSLQQKDVAVLDHYDRLIAGTHCFAHCGTCLQACPQSVPINDVLRHRMYFEDYGDQKQAMALYAKLERRADVCVTCAAPCAGSCEQGINIKERMTDAHSMLTLA